MTGSWQDSEGDSDASSTGDTDNCTICLRRLIVDVQDLPACGHRFHKACLTTALRYFSTCPLCRNAIPGVAPKSRPAPEPGYFDGGDDELFKDKAVWLHPSTSLMKPAAVQSRSEASTRTEAYGGAAASQTRTPQARAGGAMMGGRTTSVAAPEGESPKYVTYQYLTETTRPYIRTIVPVEPDWPEVR